MEVARRLVLVAQNAVRNGDLLRACAALQDLREAMSSGDAGGIEAVRKRQ
jgi:hypothetical protein